MTREREMDKTVFGMALWSLNNQRWVTNINHSSHTNVDYKSGTDKHILNYEE